MVLQKDEKIAADEHVYVCLICDTQFVHFSADEPVCPKCSARGAELLALPGELEAEDENTRD